MDATRRARDLTAASDALALLRFDLFTEGRITEAEHARLDGVVKVIEAHASVARWQAAEDARRHRDDAREAARSDYFDADHDCNADNDGTGGAL